MDIVANTANMEKTANLIMEKASDLESEIRTMLVVIDNISSIWSGDDANKYITIMKEKYIPGMLKLKEILVDYGLYLKTASQTYNVLDDNFSSKKINF